MVVQLVRGKLYRNWAVFSPNLGGVITVVGISPIAVVFHKKEGLHGAVFIDQKS